MIIVKQGWLLIGFIPCKGGFQTWSRTGREERVQAQAFFYPIPPVKGEPPNHFRRNKRALNESRPTQALHEVRLETGSPP